MPKQERITVAKNIKQDTASGTYYVTFYYGKDNAGRAIRKTRTYRDLVEAKIALQEHGLQMMKGNVVAPNKMSLSDAIEQHLEVLSLKSEASTLYGYKGIAKHIASHPLGNKPVQEVKPNDIQTYLSYLQKELSLASNTALKHYNFITSVMNRLEQQEMISRNPARRVISPKKRKHEPEYLSVEDALAIRERVRGTKIEVSFVLGLYTGMRRGEMCGLTWDNVDFNKDVLRVKVSRVNVGSEIIRNVFGVLKPLSCSLFLWV